MATVQLKLLPALSSRLSIHTHSFPLQLLIPPPQYFNSTCKSELLWVFFAK